MERRTEGKGVRIKDQKRKETRSKRGKKVRKIGKIKRKGI
jgi:hypothetical protein